MAELKLKKMAPFKYFASKKSKNIKLRKELGNWGIYVSPYTLPDAILAFDLDNLSMGDLYQMRDDPQISASLNAIAFFLHQLDFSVECEDKKIAEVTEKALRDIWTPAIKTISTALWAGYAPATFVYDIDPNTKYIKIDKIRDLAPWTCEVYTGDTSEEKSLNIFKGIKQGSEVFAPEYCFWYPYMREFGGWEGRQLLRAAYPAYFHSLVAHLFMARYYEAFGMATRIGRYPSGATVEESINGTKSEKEASTVMEDILTKQRNYSVITLPSDRDENGNFLFDIGLLESQMKGIEIEKWIQRLDQEKTLAIFTPQLLMQTGNVGSYNLGQEQKQTFLTMLNALVGDLSFYINHYILKRLGTINFGEGSPEPSLKWKPFSRAAEQQVAMILNALIQNKYADDQSLDMGALMVDLASTIGIKVEEMDELTKKKVEEEKAKRVETAKALQSQNQPKNKEEKIKVKSEESK